VPVLGYEGGGTRELINDSNGLLIHEKNEQALIQGLHDFTEKRFDRAAIAQHAREMFSEAA
jgi:glycosyltransferase involved in cell wall biosynthesis